jgi:glycosyltransferase involved in cell wall biosynthesis
MSAEPNITTVCPCFNEQSVLGIFFEKIQSVINQTGKSYEIVFINDGSIDQTLLKLLDLESNKPNIRILNFSRNFVKEAALSAGLAHSTGDVVLTYRR